MNAGAIKCGHCGAYRQVRLEGGGAGGCIMLLLGIGTACVGGLLLLLGAVAALGVLGTHGKTDQAAMQVITSLAFLVPGVVLIGAAVGLYFLARSLGRASQKSQKTVVRYVVIHPVSR